MRFFLKHFLLLFFVPFALFSQEASLASVRDELKNKHETGSKKPSLEIINVSYDPTREFYTAYNELFSPWWKERTGQDISIVQSHGGSGSQARAVISGLEADVVSLALAYDIDAIQKLSGVVGDHWQQRLPNNSSPYYSTIVFLVRKGNPKNIKNWNDLIKDHISIVTPNPKTSGGARWIYMAALAFAKETYGNDTSKIHEFMVKLYANAPVLDAGARSSTTTFVQRGMGDVLLSWENEAYLTIEKLKDEQFEIIYPALSIKAEPPVTWLNTFIKEKETEDVAKYYLKYLYSIPAQELIAKFHFRPIDREVSQKYKSKFPDVKLTSIEDFGGWSRVQEEHFKDGARFDEIFQSGRK